MYQFILLLKEIFNYIQIIRYSFVNPIKKIIFMAQNIYDLKIFL